jgi:tRNA(Ser,Leu) C12 N-acetylase TAN1
MESLEDSVTATGELVFPDDASGKTFTLQERSVYDAEDVRDELDTDIPQYGRWLPVEVETRTGMETGFLAAPSELRKRLVEESVRPNETFRVETMKKDGHGESDPYRVEISFPDREADSIGTQTGISD